MDAVVLLSGGLDSYTAAAMARRDGFRLFALTVRYGQRHQAEIDAARRVARALDVARHIELDVDLRAFGGSALTSAEPVPKDRAIIPDEIPSTYVPARNTIFLALALAYAEVRQADAIFTGANAVDYSGYPDCRPEFIGAFETLANLATRAAVEGHGLELHTPIIGCSKAEIIRRGAALGVDFALTVSCYQATEEGAACGRCDACRLRRAGFEAAGFPDPTRYARA